MNLGTVIRAARRAKDMTQEDLAGLLGVTLSAVSQWEQSRTMPDIALVPGICSALDISADMLFGLDPESKEDKIRAVIDEAVRMEERNEPPRKVLALLEDALAAYPDSMKLTAALSHTAGKKHRKTGRFSRTVLSRSMKRSCGIRPTRICGKARNRA